MAISRRRIETAVGAMILLGAASLLISVIFIGQRRGIFDRRVRLRTQFTTVEGLKPGANVHLAGIQVGSVETVFLSPDGDVQVWMEVRAGVAHRIREDSRARIKTAGLVGDRYVDITVGSADSPPVAEGDMIVGVDPVDVNQALAEAGPVLRDLAVAIENVRVVTTRMLDDESNVSRTLDNLRVITGNLREGRGSVGRLLAEDDVYEELRATLESARITIANAEALTQTARKEGPAVLVEAREAVANFNRAALRVEEVADRGLANLEEIMAGLERSVADLEAMMSNLREASEDIKAATPQLPAIVARGQEAVEESRAVLQAARAHPLLRRYFEEEELETPILVHDRAGVPDAP